MYNQLSDHDLIEKFIQTDQILHNWGRILGAIGYQLVEPKQDNSHANFFWNNEKQQLIGRIFNTGTSKAHVVLSVSEWAFLWMNQNDLRTPKISLEDKKISDVIKEFEEVMTSHQLNSDGFENKVSFKHNHLLSSHGTLPRPDADQLKLWGAMRDVANKNLSAFINEINKSSEHPIWPTNFDTAVFTMTHKNYYHYSGFSPADAVSDEPYFYTSLYKDNTSGVSPQGLNPLTYGIWKNDNWLGAVLKLSDLDSEKDVNEQVLTFFIESYKAYKKNIQ